MKSHKEALFVCNTVYQVLVALWIKYHTLHDAEVDILISDHMNGGKEISEKMQDIELFNKVYYVETRDYCYYPAKSQKGTMSEYYYRRYPECELKKFLKLDRHSYYRTLYTANLDRFSRLLANAVKHIQKDIPQIVLFEDGMSTYSLLYQNCYESMRYASGRSLKRSLSRKFFGDFYIYGNIAYALVFNPEMMQWTPSENRRLDKIDRNDSKFLNIINYVFGYNDTDFEYDKKYIFMEESYFADGKDIGDVDLVEKIADKVGKSNLMVKIHPRNPVNRFSELGYKTNTNTSMPWEVICMNISDLSEKVLITIGSSSVINPHRLFGIGCKTFSLINLVDDNLKEGTYLDGPLFDVVNRYLINNPDIFSICDTVDEIER